MPHIPLARASALLPNGFEQHNSHGGGQIQTARPVHRNGEAIVPVDREQFLRKAFGFTAENKKIARLKRHIAVGTLCLGRKKEIARGLRLCVPQIFKRVPDFDIDLLPIVEPRSLQLPVVQGKAEGLDQVENRSRSEAQPAHVARIRRDLRFNQDNVKQDSK
jgi:hypothetical protein